MDTFNKTVESRVLSKPGREKKRKTGSVSRNLAKKARHGGEGIVPAVACNHNSERVCQAAAVSPEELTRINKALYSTADKVRQDATLLSYMEIVPVKRRRAKVEDPSKHRTRELTVKYYVLRESGKIPVCKASFMSIFGIKKDRLSNIAKYWMQNGVTMPENRGGARNSEEKSAKRHISNGSFVAETYYTKPRIAWTGLSDKLTCSASESENYAIGAENKKQSPWIGATYQCNGPTADVERRLSSEDEEGSCDLSESSYVNLNKEVLVTLMFRCLECSSECRVQGKGKGGNLLFRQECLICCNYRVWTSQSAQIIKEEMPVASCDYDAERDWSPEQKSHGNNFLKQEDKVDVNSVQEEAQATSGIISFEVKQETEDDVKRGVGSLLMETYLDKAPFSSVQERSNTEGDGFSVASVSIGTIEPPHTSLTAQEEAIPDKDGRTRQFSREGEQNSSENNPDIGESSLCEPSDSSKEEECSKDSLMHQKLFQNTIKPIYWCVDCAAVANMQCTVRQHRKIFGCSACGPGDGVEGCRSRGFSVYFSDKYSFHKHAIAEHGATEIPHDRSVCQDCNKTFRVQSDPS